MHAHPQGAYLLQVLDSGPTAATADLNTQLIS